MVKQKKITRMCMNSKATYTIKLPNLNFILYFKFRFHWKVLVEHLKSIQNPLLNKHKTGILAWEVLSRLKLKMCFQFWDTNSGFKCVWLVAEHNDVKKKILTEQLWNTMPPSLLYFWQNSPNIWKIMGTPKYMLPINKSVMAPALYLVTSSKWIFMLSQF